MAASQPQTLDSDLINLLTSRDGKPTLVSVLEGNTFTVLNIAWGYDIGDEYAHVTTNVSPSHPDLSIDFFFTDRVIQISDVETGNVLYTLGQD